MPATVSETDESVQAPRRTWPARWARALTWGSARAAWRLTRWGLLLAGVLGMLATVGWMVLLWVILPRAGDWRVDLEEQATRALGVPVQIGAVQGARQGIWPTVTLRDVVLLDAQKRPGLTLPEVSARVSLATLSPWAWLDGQLRLGELVLRAPALAVRRDRNGRIHVAGLMLPEGGTANGADDRRGLDWVLTQARIRIENGQVDWTDAYLGAPTLALREVDLRLRNRMGLGRRWHELTVSATPPADVGQRFSARADLAQPWLTRPSDWRAWSGTVTARWPQVDVRRWRDHIRLPVAVLAGRGSLAADLTIDRGRAGQARVTAQVSGLRLRLREGLPELALRQLDGTLLMAHADGETVLGWQQLQFTLADGSAWPRSDARLAWREAEGRFQASRLDLAVLAELADRLPLPEVWHRQLADLAPAGVLQDLDWRWLGPAQTPTTYQLNARAQGLRLQEGDVQSGRPGLAQADLTVRATQDGGEATVAMRQGWLSFPGVFEEPRIPVEQLQAEVSWRASGPADARAWEVWVRRARFANADASGELEGQWRTSRPGENAADGQALGGLPGWLRLNGRLDQAQATRVWRYLPLSIPADTRNYVRQAFLAGVGEGVRFEVEGQLHDFPFKDDVGGRFRVDVPLRDVVMDYVPPALLGLTADAPRGIWPAMSELRGMLRFSGQRMLVEQASGRLASSGGGRFMLSGVTGRIDNLGDDDPRLNVEGEGRGPLDDALRFLARSPVGGWTGHVLDDARAAGSAAMSLKLDIPLNRTDDTTVRGEVRLAETDQAALTLNAGVPAMRQIRGVIGFTERRLSVKAQAQVWGESMQVQGERGDDGITRFNASGRMSAQGLRQASEYPMLARLATRLKGDAPVSVQVQVGEARGRQGLPHAEVVVRSSLQGMAADLPAPMNKPAQAVWPLEVRHTQEDSAGLRDGLVVDLGNPRALPMTAAAMPWLRADVRWARAAVGQAAELERGSVMLLQADAQAPTRVQPLPARGVAAQIVLDSLDLDAWSTVLAGLSPSGTPVAGTPASGMAPEAVWLPDTLSLRADRLTLRQRTLDDVTATLAHPSPGVWRLQLDARQAAGQIEWLPESGPLAERGPAGHRLVARLSRLSIPPAEAQALQQQATERLMAPDASPMPALDVVVEQFDWRGLPLGRFEVEAVNRRVASGTPVALPEWRLTRLRLSGPEAQLNATGNWTMLGAQRDSAGRNLPRSAFSFTLDVHNGGALLARLGLPQTVRGGKGQLAGNVAWQGAPLEPDADSMNGEIKVRINQGQFLKVDPGAAKLLGVLSLQALPRRLVLDFRDVFQEGFAFDNVNGDVAVARGRATTSNLRMRGVQAVVLMEGQANIRDETQDLQVYVVPDFNAGGASLAYAAINPVVGLGTFVAQMLLRKQVADAGTQVFHVSGPWSDPQVVRVLGPRPSEGGTNPAQSGSAAGSP